MKVLILRDETYVELMDALEGPAAAALLTADVDVLPDAEELHRLARAGGLPSVFALVREQLEAATDAQISRRESLHTLIIEAHRQGIGPAVLSRWSGYHPNRVYQILGPQIPS